MAQYRLLADHVIGQALVLAGTVVATADVGGILPTNWQPSGAVDPLDSAAITAFWNQGPHLLPGPIRPRWATQPVNPPAIYWQPFNLALTQYQLTGAGAALGPKCAGVVLGNNP